MPSGIKIFFLFFSQFSIFFGSLVFAQNVENSAAPQPTVTPVAAPVAPTGSEASWNLEGQLVFDIKAIQKPTGQAGIAAFQVPWLSLSAVREFGDETELRIEAMAATPTTGTTELSFRQVAVKVPRILGQATDLEVGLISLGLFTTQEDFWSLRRIGPELGLPLHRYGYVADTDYGFQLVTALSETWSFGVAMTNGEGRGQAEAGTRKDFSAWLAREWTQDGRSWLVSFFGTKGGFENLPSSENNRDRSQVTIATTKAEGLSFSAEYNWTWDPADGLHNVAADKVNLASLAGTRVNGIGYASILSYAFKTESNLIWSLFSRADRWEPIKGDGNYAINSSQIGLGYKPRSAVQWYIYNSLTSYGQTHSTSARDQQNWRIALDLKFD